jgi:hypothetical protein
VIFLAILSPTKYIDDKITHADSQYENEFSIVKISGEGSSLTQI